MNAPIRYLGFSLLFAAAFLAPTARAQLMLLTMKSSHMEADFYDYDVAHTDWDNTSYITHYRHPIAGTMYLQSYIDFRNPAEPGNAGIAFWGNAEGIGEFHYEFGAFTLTPQPSGSIDLWVNTWLQESPYLNLVFGIRINRDFTVDPSWGSEFEFRTYLMEGPGEFWGDSTLWADFDHITLTPVPEPSAYGAIAGLGILGIVGWRSRRRSRAVLTS